MLQIKLLSPDYKLFEYEKEFAEREITNLLSPTQLEKVPEGYILSSAIENEIEALEKARKLTFIGQIVIENQVTETNQRILEKSCSVSGSKRRQSTKYGAHGLHDYKGKFNPQTVSSIFNILNLQPGSKVLDPFCGSGTTLVESQYKGFDALGLDINPLAVFLANAKLNAPKANFELIKVFLDELPKKITAKRDKLLNGGTSREIYLKKWLIEDIYEQLEALKTLIGNIKDTNTANVLLCCASNIIRDYSLQEPSDLRIRRRKSDLPTISFVDSFISETNRFLKNFESIDAPVEFSKKCQAFHADIRSQDSLLKLANFDAAITSPPYATALPYIDTQRLSLVWLSIIKPEEINSLEAELIGSRELRGNTRKKLKTALEQSTGEIPQNLKILCHDLLNNLSENDGFRRQAVPYLLYRYFLDMGKMFSNVSKRLKTGAPFALVVGHNHTTLGGKRFDLDTPQYLAEIGVHFGWKIQENISLNTYPRYGIHSSNAVAKENLLILENS